MKYLYIICLLSSLTGFSQGKSELTSAFRRINTLAFFNKKLPPIPRKDSSAHAFVKHTETVLFFDRDGKKTSAEMAYFYRRVKFNQRNIPIGIVEDFYRETNKPKFRGSYFIYKSDDEKNNIVFQGDCVFYNEDDSKSERKYKDGKLQEEKNYLADGRLKSEQTLNLTKTSKVYYEYNYVSYNKVGESIVKVYDLLLKKERQFKEYRDKNGKIEKVIEYEGECPKSDISYFKEDGKELKAVLQEFACQNVKDWIWAGTQSYNKNFLNNEKKYQIVSTNTNEGFLTIPISNNLRSVAFELVAEFEKPRPESIKEVGIVWQYLNEQNYSYFLINTEKNTFDVSMKINGEFRKYMIGIKNQITIPDLNNKYVLKINSTQSKTEYYVNGVLIKGFNKIPLNPVADSRKVNTGMLFKPSKPNEYILLNKFEFKLL